MSIRFRSQDGTVHDSGMHEPQLNLLAHAQAIELPVGSECGGHGICGGDRVVIPAEHRDRFSPVTEAERTHLKPAEIQAGHRLACQCFPEAETDTSLAEARVEIQLLRA